MMFNILAKGFPLFFNNNSYKLLSYCRRRLHVEGLRFIYSLHCESCVYYVLPLWKGVHRLPLHQPTSKFWKVAIAIALLYCLKKFFFSRYIVCKNLWEHRPEVVEYLFAVNERICCPRSPTEEIATLIDWSSDLPGKKEFFEYIRHSSITYRPFPSTPKRHQPFFPILDTWKSK